MSLARRNWTGITCGVFIVSSIFASAIVPSAIAQSESGGPVFDVQDDESGGPLAAGESFAGGEAGGESGGVSMSGARTEGIAPPWGGSSQSGGALNSGGRSESTFSDRYDETRTYSPNSNSTGRSESGGMVEAGNQGESQYGKVPILTVTDYKWNDAEQPKTPLRTAR